VREDAIVDIWQRTTSHVLTDVRLEEFRARSEFRILGMYPTNVLERAAQSAWEDNPHHHLLLTEWLGRCRGPRSTFDDAGRSGAGGFGRYHDGGTQWGWHPTSRPGQW
jgi:hypothetical protein